MKKSLYVFCLCTAICFLILGCLPTAENTEIVTSDGVTNNGSPTDPEILPNATVFLRPDMEDDSILSIFLAMPVEGLSIQFYAKEFEDAEDAWVELGGR